MGKDRPIAQKRQRLMSREIAVRIDAGGLNPAIPDIAVDITGQKLIKYQHVGSQEDPKSPDDPQLAIEWHALGQGSCYNPQPTRGLGQSEKDLVITSTQ